MFQYTPYALLIFGASLISLLTALIVWRRRPGTGVIMLFVLTMVIAYWSFIDGVELLVTDPAVKAVLRVFLYTGVVATPASWLAFILQYTGRSKWLTKRTVILLTIMPVITIATLATNGLHSFFFSDVSMSIQDGLITPITVNGPGFWIHAGYSYVVLLTGAILLIQTLFRSRQFYRGQIIWMLIGTFAPWIGNAIYIFEVSPLPSYVDLTPMAFTITGAAYTWSMYRHRLMDIVPVAKDIIIDNLIDAVIVLDRNNRIVETNPKALEILGMPASEVIGHSAATVMSNQTELVERYGDVEQAHDEISVVLNGEDRIFDLSIMPLHNRQGTLTGRVMMLHDITELKQANKDLVTARRQAEEANRLKSEFLATMSHELRTPLNAIIGFTEIMLAGMGGIELNGKTLHMTERVHANSKDLLALINDVLDLAKVEARRVELVNKPFSPAGLMQDIHKELMSLADKKSLKFKLDIAANMPSEIIGDQFQIRRVVTNLLSNAFKFTEQGSVTLATTISEKDTWAITVSDTGIGIAPHALEFIFDPFRQVDGTSQRAYGGTGLGLAITQELVKSMSGIIQVKAELGKGSTFTVTLPVITVSEQEKEEATA